MRSFLATRPTRKRRTIPTFGLEQRTSGKWNEPFWRSLIDEKKGSALPDEAFAEPTYLVCEELTPTLAEQFRRLSIAGVIQLGGGTTSHGAILARALGLPAIGGARKSLERLRTAQRVAIDGSDGSLWIDPPPDVLADLVGRQQGGAL